MFIAEADSAFSFGDSMGTVDLDLGFSVVWIDLDRADCFEHIMDENFIGSVKELCLSKYHLRLRETSNKD